MMAFRSLLWKLKSSNNLLNILHSAEVIRSSSKLIHSQVPFVLCSRYLLQNIAATFVNHVGKENQSRRLHLTACCDAGHSKWSNIKHIKGAQDKARGEKTNVLARKLSLVLTKNPEKDPKLNTELAGLIKWARSNNIPNDAITRAIERTSQLRDSSNLTVFQGRGLSNIGIVLECFALKPVHTKGLLQGVIKKYGFNLNSSAEDLFEHKGIVEVEVSESELATAQSDPESFPMDKYVDIAIEAGAEDVTLHPDSYKPFLEFICGPQDCDKVQINVEKAGLVVLCSERSYIPTVHVPASKEFLQNLDILKSKLDKHPDVIKYYFNIVPES